MLLLDYEIIGKCEDVALFDADLPTIARKFGGEPYGSNTMPMSRSAASSYVTATGAYVFASNDQITEFIKSATETLEHSQSTGAPIIMRFPNLPREMPLKTDIGTPPKLGPQS
jgi:hypothetical protein